MHSGNNIVELSQRQPNDTMKKANLFLRELTDIPLKYAQEDREEFIREFNELNDHQKYTCVEIILSNAWGHINTNRLAKARADLAFILPLCVQKDQRQLDFPEFEVDRMLLEAWANDKEYSIERREKYVKLLEECGFQFQKYSLPPEKIKKRSGFKKFLDVLTCKCCGKAN